MKIIEATIDDVPRILECAKLFCDVLKWPLNEDYYAMFWKSALASHSGVIFLLVDGAEVLGGIGGIAKRDLLSGEVNAIELFWYIKPEHRHGVWSVKLLKSFEQWAARQNCKRVSMVLMADSMADRLTEFYTRAGYRHLETVYSKEIV